MKKSALIIILIASSALNQAQALDLSARSLVQNFFFAQVDGSYEVTSVNARDYFDRVGNEQNPFSACSDSSSVLKEIFFTLNGDDYNCDFSANILPLGGADGAVIVHGRIHNCDNEHRSFEMTGDTYYLSASPSTPRLPSEAINNRRAAKLRQCR